MINGQRAADLTLDTQGDGEQCPDPFLLISGAALGQHRRLEDILGHYRCRRHLRGSGEHVDLRLSIMLGETRRGDHHPTAGRRVIPPDAMSMGGEQLLRHLEDRREDGVRFESTRQRSRRLNEEGQLLFHAPMLFDFLLCLSIEP